MAKKLHKLENITMALSEYIFKLDMPQEFSRKMLDFNISEIEIGISITLCEQFGCTPF